MAERALDPRVEAVRRFNRFYTKQIGVLREGLLETPFSLAEARVLYELAHRETPTASELRADLGLDPGYLSRILRGFRKDGLIGSKPAEKDGRRSLLWLTRKGRTAFANLDKRSRTEVGSMIRKLPPAAQDRLVEAMRTIEALLDPSPEPRAPYVLRPHQPGDMGWVVHRHGVLYGQEQGWDERFEGVVARIVADFVRDFDPRHERCWIAERDGAVVGSVFLVRKSQTVAKLRLLLVEPSARGLGIGRRLVDECLRFGRQAGYRKITLWTNSILHAARHIYQQTGFRLVHRAPHNDFGHDLIGETWERALVTVDRNPRQP